MSLEMLNNLLTIMRRGREASATKPLAGVKTHPRRYVLLNGVLEQLCLGRYNRLTSDPAAHYPVIS